MKSKYGTLVVGKEWLELNLLGLLPLFILSKDGRNFEVLDEVIRRLSEANEQALLVITRLFAEAAFPTDEEKAEIARKFAMLQDIETTPTYQRLVGKGREERQLQEARKVLMGMIQAYFPSLHALAEAQLELTTDPNVLRQATIQPGRAKTDEEAQKILQGLQETLA